MNTRFSKKRLFSTLLASATLASIGLFFSGNASAEALKAQAFVADEKTPLSCGMTYDPLGNIQPRITVAKPTYSVTSGYAGVAFQWTGDRDGYLRLRTGSSSVIVDDYTYSEVAIPNVDDNIVYLKYFRAESIFYDAAEDRYYYSGEVETPGREQSRYKVSATMTDDTISNRGRALSFPEDVEIVCITIGYHGVMQQARVLVPLPGDSSGSASLSFYSGVNQLTFNVSVYTNHTLSITTSIPGTYRCSNVSSSLDDNVAIGFVYM